MPRYRKLIQKERLILVPHAIEYRSKKYAKIGLLRFFAALLLAPSLFGQSTSSLSWSAKNIHSIQLTLPFVTKLKSLVKSVSSIKIDYQTEGEYQKELRLKSEEINRELRLEEQLAPSLRHTTTN